MRLDNFIEGLKILQQYYIDSGYHIGSDHDQIYCYKTDFPLSIKDVERLKNLGWSQVPRSEDDEYDPEQSWVAFV